jgi:hypothetical protein
MAINMKFILFRDLMPCSLVDIYGDFGGPSCFSTQCTKAEFSALNIEAKYFDLKMMQQISPKFNKYCDMTSDSRKRGSTEDVHC